ncbi:MAG: rod shape-determining protein MreD [Lachnospiraceae bacterium]|nr:rod shape-determining protein MreD [Lachnospiraceae bacterium]
MRRYLIVAIMIWAGFLLQSTVFRAISIAGIVPNVLIILTSSFGFMRGRKEGMVIGFFCGLLMDIFFGDIIGFYALIFLFIGYINGLFKAIFYPEDIKLPMILISASELMYCIFCYVFLFLLRGRMNFPYYLVHIILPEIVYTTVATLVIYRGILYANEWLEEYEKRS